MMHIRIPMEGSSDLEVAQSTDIVSWTFSSLAKDLDKPVSPQSPSSLRIPESLCSLKQSTNLQVVTDRSISRISMALLQPNPNTCETTHQRAQSSWDTARGLCLFGQFQ